ncbi:MAG: LUD domain-containing protein [Gemmatimonadota bacterium]|nr:LUD domain-containing protein [Gemmatimonadota bacterium]
MSGSAPRRGRRPRGDGGGARAQVLARVIRATALRDRLPHPGPLQTPTPADPVATFVKRFTSQGGEVATPDPDRSPRDWLTSFLQALDDDVTTIAVGADVPERLRPRPRDVPPANAGAAGGESPAPLRREVAAAGLRNSVELLPDAVPAAQAAAGISLAWGAVAETGSLILPSTGTRAVQLLPPVHIVWVPAGRVFARLEDALLRLQPRLPAGVGLHSGPSKSADIGRTVVTGVHGPGRCIAVLAARGQNPPGIRAAMHPR